MVHYSSITGTFSSYDRLQFMTTFGGLHYYFMPAMENKLSIISKDIKVGDIKTFGRSVTRDRNCHHVDLHTTICNAYIPGTTGVVSHAGGIAYLDGVLVVDSGQTLVRYEDTSTIGGKVVRRVAQSTLRVIPVSAFVYLVINVDSLEYPDGTWGNPPVGRVNAFNMQVICPHDPGNDSFWGYQQITLGSGGGTVEDNFPMGSNPTELDNAELVLRLGYNLAALIEKATISYASTDYSSLVSRRCCTGFGTQSKTLQSYSVLDTVYDDQGLLTYFRRVLSDVIVDNARPPWGQLCHSAIQDFVFPANGLTLYHDLSSSFSELFDAVSFLKHPSIHSASHLFLGVKYGTRLTYQDVSEYYKSMKHNLDDYHDVCKSWYGTGRARSSISVNTSLGEGVCNLAYTVKATARDSFGSALELSLVQTGFAPTFKNLWDLVPFSFVVDWFADVQSVAEALDDRLIAQVLDVLSVIQTQKVIVPFKLSGQYVLGSVPATFTWYRRDVSTRLTFPSLGIDSSSQYQNHVLELGAIICHVLT